MQSQDLKRSNPVYFLYTLMYSPKNTLNFFFIFFPYSENPPKFFFFFLIFDSSRELCDKASILLVPLLCFKGLILNLHYPAELAPSYCSRHPSGASDFAKKDFSAKFLQTLIGSARALPGLGDEKMQPPVTWERMKKNEATLRKGIIRVHLPRLGMVKAG